MYKHTDSIRFLWKGYRAYLGQNGNSGHQGVLGCLYTGFWRLEGSIVTLVKTLSWQMSNDASSMNQFVTDYGEQCRAFRASEQRKARISFSIELPLAPEADLLSS